MLKNRFIILPFAFIILYGSGFVFTKFGLENSSPMAFLSLRFFIAFSILVLISYFLKVSWPKSFIEFFHIATAGSLTVGVFSIGIFLSLSYNVEASLSSLIISLQPILVAFLAHYVLKERLTLNISLGLFVGFIGVFLVVGSKITNNDIQIEGILFSFMGLLGLSSGALYQKKFCSNMNLYSGGAIQTFSSTILTLPFLYFEEVSISFNLDFLIALGYMSVGVSIGALSLLYIMIREGAVSKVSSIFYLVPVSAVVISYLLFKIDIDISVIIGVFVIFISIGLINRKKSISKN